MSLTIIKQFEPRRRRLYRNGTWSEVDMAAFVGATGVFQPNCKAQLGVGLMQQKEDGSGNGDRYLFWGTMVAHCLITAWRAAQVVDMITEVRENVLFSAYALSIRGSEQQMDGFMGILKGALPVTYLPGLRTNMLETCVPDQELEEMLAICNAPDSNIKVSADELEEELIEGTIHCTPGVRAVFDRAGLEGWKPLEIKEASRKPLALRQSFVEFCRQAKIKKLCACFEDEEMMQLGLSGVDEYIVYIGYRYGLGRHISCKVRRSGKVMHVGNPVLSLADGSKWALREVLYKDKRMLMKVWALSGQNEGNILTVPLVELAEKSPQMVGVTFGRDDVASVQERKWGYIALESFWQRLRKRFGLGRSG